MSSLSQSLKEFFDRSSYQSVTDLTEATQAHGTVSRTYISHMLTGRRQNPSRDKLMAVARALQLDSTDRNKLLVAAGFPPQPSLPPNLKKALAVLEQLGQMPNAPIEAIEKIAEGVIMLAEGAIIALSDAAPVQQLRPLPAQSLDPEEGLIDDLLGDIISQDVAHPLDKFFDSLDEIAQSDRWEAKRRIAETLPRLVQLQPDRTLHLADILRSDYHPDYRADIRRRTIEAMPALYQHRPDAALRLLAHRDQDEVHTAMATVEALHDLRQAGRIDATAEAEYVARLQYTEPLHENVVADLRRWLDLADSDPDAALADLEARKREPERLVKIAIQRLSPRLLKTRPKETLALQFYFLRKDESGRPVEHQNLRRPVSRALSQVFEALEREPALEADVERLLSLLTVDPDIHVRRALSDALDRLAVLSDRLTVGVLDRLLQDSDAHIRQRAWRTLLRLADLYPKRAEEFYGRLLTPKE